MMYNQFFPSNKDIKSIENLNTSNERGDYGSKAGVLHHFNCVALAQKYFCRASAVIMKQASHGNIFFLPFVFIRLSPYLCRQRNKMYRTAQKGIGKIDSKVGSDKKQR